MESMRTLVSFLGGAASVGVVVGVLAIAGVIDNDSAQSPSSSSNTTLAPNTGNNKPIPSQPTNVSEIYKRVSPGVVFVQSTATGGGSGGGQGLFGQQGGQGGQGGG